MALVEYISFMSKLKRTEPFWLSVHLLRIDVPHYRQPKDGCMKIESVFLTNPLIVCKSSTVLNLPTKNGDFGFPFWFRKNQIV